MTATITLLAQADAQPGGGFMQMAVAMGMIGMLYYVMFVVPQRAQSKRLDDLAKSLKENDHILTNSGVYGVVTGVQRDANKATIRIDEATGAKMRITIDSIGRVLSDEDKKEKA